ncbi:hypothetical protein E8M24_30760 [Bacillus thuringiensis]|nr:hypothetical protein E8M24_30760 [Bacillus thuringiensis]PFN23960.1 hypothetical protein COJ69_08840 [Bacillus cereus]PGP46560.1 hypothetical protein CN993_07830 [Bacillus thuringiensis]QWG71304.1 hypothetical protein EXW63_03580 [Bacillus mycoides]QWH22882.1 hypothetical protein EXW50_10825 [Bacillus mycoides]
MKLKTLASWSFKDKLLFLFCFILPLIGLIYILINRKKWNKKETSLYLLFALTNLSLTITVTFITRDFWIVTLHYIISIILISYFIFTKNTNKSNLI